MAQLIHYTHCPVCGSADIRKVLSAKDYTVSGEEFTVMECKSCSLRFTQGVPDAASIAPYYKSEEYISHTNTSKGLVNRLYQSVRKKTLKQKRKLVEKETGSTKGRILDLGAGIGAFVNEMKKAGWEVTALEPDAGARKLGKELYGIEMEDTGQFYQLPEASYDAITLWHVLEHVHDLQGYIARLRSLLNEKGRLIIAVPNYTSGDAAVYGEHWAAYDVPRHLYHFSPRSMQVLMEKHGLKIRDYKPMWYDSFYVSMLSSKYKRGKTNLAGAFFRGLGSNIKAMRDVKRCSSVIYIMEKAVSY
ncbi:MAG TPA: class I SAM-dependent methyltransferase [Chitinophagaceae bacterium]|jgi:2-polyprenyl-3-methyl-5-hydroxy-6-metoxy-1,4-benzoquinol methylase|nr:class I SAM-dependent methyltransferase [Chitinophagaceae bacterium]